MNDAQKLAQLISDKNLADKIMIDGPTQGGYWWVDFWAKERSVSVEWRPRQGFGISFILNNDWERVAFSGPDEIYDILDQALQRIILFLAESS